MTTENTARSDFRTVETRHDCNGYGDDGTPCATPSGSLHWGATNTVVSEVTGQLRDRVLERLSLPDQPVFIAETVTEGGLSEYTTELDYTFQLLVGDTTGTVFTRTFGTEHGNGLVDLLTWLDPDTQRPATSPTRVTSSTPVKRWDRQGRPIA